MIPESTIVDVELWLIEQQTVVRAHYAKMRERHPGGAPLDGFAWIDRAEREELARIEMMAALVLARQPKAAP